MNNHLKASTKNNSKKLQMESKVALIKPLALFSEYFCQSLKLLEIFASPLQHKNNFVSQTSTNSFNNSTVFLEV